MQSVCRVSWQLYALFAAVLIRWEEQKHVKAGELVLAQQRFTRVRITANGCWVARSAVVMCASTACYGAAIETTSHNSGTVQPLILLSAHNYGTGKPAKAAGQLMCTGARSQHCHVERRRPAQCWEVCGVMGAPADPCTMRKPCHCRMTCCRRRHQR